MSIYQNLYNLITEYVFGNSTLTSIQELCVTLVSLGGCIFLVALPFLLVWKVIKLI